MTLKLKDRVKETSNSSGTGPILVYGTSLSFKTFGSELENGETTYYGAIEVSGPDWEVGLGTYNSSPPSIIRTTILSSSNNNNIVNFGANTKDVFITYPGERIMELAYGGTGATDSANARINLGVSIGSDVQGWDPDLDSIATLVGSSGLLKKNSANTWTLDTSNYLTSESDTFSSVTSRGSSTPTQIHITNTTNASSSNGAIIVDGGISVANNIYVGDNLSVENYIDLNTSSNPVHQEGRLFYNTTNKSLSVYNDEADISLEVGQENWVRVYNNTGNTIFSSSPVSFSGAILGTPLVVLSDSSDYTTIIKVAGLAAHDIETSSFGYVTTSGKIPNVNTASYSVGTQLYVSGTEVGKLSSTVPVYPNFTVKVGIVLESNVAGSIFVNIQNNTLSDLNVISDARINGGLTVTGNLSITGTTTTIAATNLSIADNMIYLNNAIQTPISNASGNGVIVSYTTSISHNYSSGMSVTVTGVDPSAYNVSNKTILDVTSNTFSISSNVTSSYVSGGTARAKSSTNPDLGFAAGYNDGTYHHTGLFRDASDGIWKFFKNYIPEPDASPYIDTSHASFELAPLSVSDVTAANTITSPSFVGDLSGTAAAATNISDGGSNQIPFQTGISSTAFNSNLTFDPSNSALSTQNIIISGNTSLGAVDNISITGGTDGYVLTTDGSGNLSWLQATQNTVIYVVQSLSLANGVYVSGSLSDIQTFADSNYYTLTDGTGTGPAWVFTTGFTDVVSFNRVVLNINYTAASGHTIYVQLYNNDSTIWDTIGTYTGLGSFYAFALQVISDTKYISSGAVQLRLWHSNAGNALHTTNIEYVALEMSTQGPQGPKGTTGTTGSTGSTGAGVATGGTSGQILIKNSATNYDTSWVNNLAYDAANTANLNAANASYLSSGTVSNSLLSSIPNSSLANSTISGIQLGSNLNALSNGTGLLWSSGTNFNGSSAATLTIDSSVVTLTGSQTLTNKKLTLPVVDFTGIKIDGSTSGNTTIQATPIAGSSILTLSANTGTLISTGDTGTITSTMILNGTIVDADINSAAAISTSKLAANTISGVHLGDNLFSLVTGSGLNGGSFNGSGSVTISANTGSTTVAGILQLNDTIVSTSTSLAATANSVKTAYDQATNANTFNKSYTDSVVSSNNTTLKAYTDSVVSSNNVSLKAYTDSVVSSNNTTLKAYTDSVVSSNNSSLRANDGITLASAKSYTDSANTFLQANDGITLASAKSYTDSANTFLQANDGITLATSKSYTDSANTFLQANDGITLASAKSYTDSANTFLQANDGITLASAKSYTDSVVSSNNVSLKSYTDSLVSSNNTSLTTAYKSYTDSVNASNNVTLKAYTDSLVSSNNTSLTTAYKSYTDSVNASNNVTLKAYTDSVVASNNVTLKAYTDSVVSSNNVTLKAYTDSVVSSNNSSLRANDGITLASAKSYTDSANTFLQANDGITLASAKSYTDSKNTFSTLVNISNDLIVTGNLTIQGTTTTLNSTTLKINDRNIELANVATPTNTTADGGGITVIGATNKTFNWVNSTGAWTSSENLDLASGKSFSIGGTTVLTGSTLSSNVTTSSLTAVGTVTSGVWNAGSVTASQLTSTVATGTAPFVVTSNTVVTNLNADLLDGLSSLDFKAYTDSVVASNNSSLIIAYKSYTDSVVSSNNTSLKVYTDSVVASNNSSLRANDGITLASAKSYTDTVNASNNTTLKAYTDSVVASNNTSLKTYTDSVVSSNNTSITTAYKSYTDSVVSSNNTTLKAYTDSTVASNNVTLKAYTDSVVSSNNSSLRANDGITLASARSYTDSANTFLQANDGITLASAKSYTDSVVASNNTTITTAYKSYIDSVVSSNNTTITTAYKSYTDSVNASNNVTLKAYTDSTVASNNTTITTAYKSYTDSVNASNNVTLKAYTDSVVSSNNSSLRANDGITLASAKSYTDSVNASNNVTLKAYTDSVNASNNVTLKAYTDSVNASNNVTLKAYTDSVVSSNNSSITTAYKSYTDSVVSSNNSSITTAYKSYTDSVNASNNVTLKAYTDSVVSSNNSSITTAYKSYTDSVNASNNVTLKAYTDSVNASNNVTLKAYTDSVNASNNVTLKAYTDSVNASNNSSITTAYKSYTDSVNASNNVTLKAYTDSVNASNNVTLKAYTDSVNASNNVTLKAYTDSVVSSNNSSLRANDGITLASAKSYTDAKNTFSTLVNISNDLIVTGNLTIQGTTTTLNSTTIRINDKNLELANVATPTNTTADGGGITVIGATNKTFNWVNSTGAWTSSENLDLASGKSFSIGGTTVLTGSTLSSNVTTSSLTAVGTITSGVWSSSFGAVSGANLTNLTAGNLVGVINNIPIGSGTANTGAFTTLSASGQIISTAATTTSSGGGSVYLNGSNNRIDFNTSGAAAPTTTTRSVGTKIVLYPSVGVSSSDFAIGIEDSTMWSSVAGSANQFKWYAGTTNIATLSGTGNFSTSTLTSTVATGTAPFTVTSTTNVANLNASSLSGATFASPGPIGSGTASTGAFTTLSASSTVSGAGFSAYLASPPAIGSTTANTGAFTNLSYTGTLTGGTGVIAIGTNQIYKDASGNVGIGTSSPAYKLQVVGSFAATTKSFVIDHPTKEGMKLRYGSLEGPENGIYIRGRLNGNNIIELPEYWTKLIDEDSITVNLTPIGKHQKLYVVDIVNNTVIVGNDNLLNKEINCFYTIFAERIDVEKLIVEIE